MHPVTPADRQAGTLAIAILGADAILAVLPATPVQIAHACLAAGYDVAVPASWGDELLAAECLRQLAARGPRPAVMCACPHVRSELLAVGPDLAPVLVSLVPPPVAVARYLRALYGRDRLHLTYVGGCPGACDATIDAVASPADFFSSLAISGISLTDQPRVFDSVLPPDRRRFFSIAGGVPSAEQLWSVGNGRSLVELDGEDYLIDLAQHLLSHECALIDLAPRLGCACSGASASIPARSARAAVAVIEPPRASSAVIDVAIAIDVLQPIESGGGQGSETSGGALTDTIMTPREETPTLSREPGHPTMAATPGGARRSPAAGIRTLQSALPTARVAGRMVPRGYFARRRTNLIESDTPSTGVPITPLPVPSTVDPGVEDHGRRAPARVAASARAREERPAASVAAGAVGAPEKMSDGPRT
jgi:hypothetical protein